MEKKKKRNISIEVASSDHSDIEITEIYLRFVKDSYADYLLEKKRYRLVETSVGKILLPPYHLVYDPVVTLGLKYFWIFPRFTYQGIRI